MKDRHLRARLPEDEYIALGIAASRAGMTISEYVRCVVARDRQAASQDQFLARLDAKLANVLRPPDSDAEAQSHTSTALEPLLVEALFLIRELVADRNAQALGRVGQQLNQLYPGRKKV